MSILETEKKMTTANLKAEIATLKQMVLERDQKISQMEIEHKQEIRDLNNTHWQEITHIEAEKRAYMIKVREEMMYIYKFAQQMIKFENGETIWQRMADMSGNDNIKY